MLGAKFRILDPAFFYIRKSSKLTGVCVTYVDEMFHAKTKNYIKLSETIGERFHCSSLECGNTYFAEMELETNENGRILHQRKYFQKLNPTQKETFFTTF